ncbi:hypothetical protein SEPCBS119000_004807 [Sporothrix epigloea]|uniref:Uncharacterized protein n=1 Tax=Sporothrix epigloea TaxID=1892477 RepID=A0ABP0DY04_9PEZI
MAPVPIYSQSPISAAKPSGVTPQTEDLARDVNRAPPETPTKTRPLTAGPPPPQPGAVPSLARPTGAGQNQYASPPPATTTPATSLRTQNYSPAPPQPGAAAVPPSTTSANPSYQQVPPPATITAAAVLPPPPRVGETLASTGIHNHPPTPTATTMPPQMGISPLVASPYPASSRGTATYNQSDFPGTPQPLGSAQGPATHEQHPPSLSHPPGYIQNAYTAEMTASAREAANMSSVGLPSYHNSRNNAIDNESYGSGAAFGGGDEPEGIWDAAKKLAWSAGERLSAAETEIWKLINKEE